MGSTKSAWGRDRFLAAVSKSSTIAEAILALGLNPQGNYRTFHKYSKLYGADTSHFTGRAHLKGKRRKLPRRPLSQILVKCSFYAPRNLKSRLIEEGLLKYKCSDCDISEWNGNRLSLQLDHVNGDRFDNRLENLRLLCPNCHSQTETFCAKNRAKRKAPQTRECKCGETILYSSNGCRRCAAESRGQRLRKIVWPSKDGILRLVQEKGFLGAGKELGVSDNAIRKHLKRWT
jgi:hypothetical protein